MKIIATTPLQISLPYVKAVRLSSSGEPIEEETLYEKAIRTPGKHLLIEYDEHNGNLVKACIDLDALGLSDIKTVEEAERYLGGYTRYEESAV